MTLRSLADHLRHIDTALEAAAPGEAARAIASALAEHPHSVLLRQRAARAALAGDRPDEAARLSAEAAACSPRLAFPAVAGAARVAPSAPMRPAAPVAADVEHLLQLMHTGVRRVLHLGCGAGHAGAALKSIVPGVEVVGIERDPALAAQARTFLDAVVVGDPETVAGVPGVFDMIMLTGGLEALRQPEVTIARYVAALAPGGHLVLSVENRRHYAAILADETGAALSALLTPPSAADGLRLDGYHAVARGLEGMGLVVDHVDVTREVPDEAAFRAIHQHVATHGGDADAFRHEGGVTRYFLRLRRVDVAALDAPPPARPLAAPDAPPVASIVMLTLNQLAYTRLCVESLRAHRTVPYELLVVDNASTDGTGDYLAALAAELPWVKVVTNARNMGFAYGCNQGIVMASSETIILLNNDTVVTEGWCEGLLRPLELEPRIGAVGPRTGQTVGPQLVPFVPYGGDMVAMAAYARRVARLHPNAGRLAARAIGFCVAIRREIFDRIGGLDTRFGIGNFEDDDLSLRIQTAGYAIWLTDEVYIHHFGHATFVGERVDFGKLMTDNGRKFAEKWGLAFPFQGYDGHALAGSPFDPARDVCPILVPSAPPVPIDGAKRDHVLLMPDWRDPASAVPAIAAFCRAFTAADDIALLLWVDTEGTVGAADVADALGPLLASAGLDGPSTPELVLFEAPGNPAAISHVYASAGAVMPLAASHAEAATACGLVVLDDWSPEGLKARFATVPEGAPA